MSYLNYVTTKLLYSMGKVPFLPHIAFLRAKLFAAKHFKIGDAWSIGLEFLANGDGGYLKKQLLWSEQNLFLMTIVSNTTDDDGELLREIVNGVEEETTELALACYGNFVRMAQITRSTDPQMLFDYLMLYPSLSSHVVHATADKLRALEADYEGVLPKIGFTNLDNFRTPKALSND